MLQLLLLLILPLFTNSCLLSHVEGCPCAPIQVIDKSGIRKLEYGSYLANRTTTKPRVTVTDECQILADVSELDTQNHYLMVFREGAPPIFAKRLSNDTDKVINLSDITCVKNQWQYRFWPIDNISIAVQSNEEMCSCDYNFEIRETIEIENVTCDTFRLFENSGGIVVRQYNFFDNRFVLAGTTLSPNLLLDDMTCVDGTWYLNSVPVVPAFSTDWLQSDYCGCKYIGQLGTADSLGYTLDPEGSFANWTVKSGGLVSYDGCSAEIQCSGSDTLVVFSAHFKPKIVS